MREIVEMWFHVDEAFDPERCDVVNKIPGDGFEGEFLVGARYKNTRFENGYGNLPMIFRNCTFEHCLFYNWEFKHGVQFRNCFFIDCAFVRIHTLDIEFTSCVMDNVAFVLNADQHIDIVYHTCVVDGGGFYIYESDTKTIREPEALDVSIWFKYCTINSLDLESVPSKSVLAEETFFSGTYPSSNPSYVLPVCPPVGSFIAFKKAWTFTRSGTTMTDVVVKLNVLDDAQRVSGVGRKCRCSAAEVLDIYDPYSKAHYSKARSCFDVNFVYEVGQVVKVEDFDPKPFVCSRGIHFFLSEGEAIKYNF